MKLKKIPISELIKLDAHIVDRDDYYIHRDSSLVYYDTCEKFDELFIKNIYDVSYGSSQQYYYYNAINDDCRGYAYSCKTPLDYSYYKLKLFDEFKYLFSGFDNIQQSIRKTTNDKLSTLNRLIKTYDGDEKTADTIINYLCSFKDVKVADNEVKKENKKIAVLSIKNPLNLCEISDDIRRTYNYLLCLTVIKPPKKYAIELYKDVKEQIQLISSIKNKDARDTIASLNDQLITCISVSIVTDADCAEEVSNTLLDYGILTYRHEKTLEKQYKSIFPGNAFEGVSYQYSVYSSVANILEML